MSSLKDERNRILSLVEAGQINAAEASQLLDALERDARHRAERTRERVLRVRTTNLHMHATKTHMSTTIPVQLLRNSLRLGAYLVPQLEKSALEDLLQAIEHGSTGCLLDVQDMAQGQRLEIFVE